MTNGTESAACAVNSHDVLRQFVFRNSLVQTT